MKKVYKPHRFNSKRADIIAIANHFIEQYLEQGYTITLRQLFYKFVATDKFPDDRKFTQVTASKWVRDQQGTKNAEPNYKWLSEILTDGRLGGYIDWNCLEDRLRQTQFWRINEHYETILSGLGRQYAVDMWTPQDTYIEVWVEKDALSGVIEKACRKYRVPYLACRGYMSTSASYEAGERFRSELEDGKQCVLIHLGDHDPSGIDMTRDNKDRVDLFSQLPDAVEVRRLALNMDQVKEYNPPPNPAKVKDSRAPKYVERYGKNSWELDALEPSVIEELISNEIELFLDRDIWDECLTREAAARQPLRQISTHWEDIRRYLRNDELMGREEEAAEYINHDRLPYVWDQVKEYLDTPQLEDNWQQVREMLDTPKLIDNWKTVQQFLKNLD